MRNFIRGFAVSALLICAATFAQTINYTANPPTGSCGGDLGGSYPNCTVTAYSGTTTGTGSVVRQTSPSLVTPALGVATATSINGNTFTTGTYTLTGGSGKTLTFNNTLTLTGTDSTTITFPTTSATMARTDAAQTFTGLQTLSNGLSVSGAAISLNTGSASAVNINNNSGASTTTIGNASSTLNIVAGTIQRSGSASGLPRTFTTTYDPASLAAATTRTDSVTVTGITTTGGAVAANPGAAFTTSCVVAAVRASATDTVAVTLRNTIDAVTACDEGSSTWTFTQAQ